MNGKNNTIIIILLLALSVLPTYKAQSFEHLSFSSTLQLINGISRDLRKLLKYFNGAAIDAFFRILSAVFRAAWATVFPNDLDLYLELSLLTISALKLVASSLE